MFFTILSLPPLLYKFTYSVSYLLVRVVWTIDFAWRSAVLGYPVQAQAVSKDTSVADGSMCASCVAMWPVPIKKGAILLPIVREDGTFPTAACF